MSEYRTLDEFFPSGRGDGRKFTTDGWEKHACIEPIFLSKPCYVYETTWHCLDEGGHSYPILRERLQLRFKEWHPPKKKVTKYLWYNSINSSTSGYMAENSAQLSLLLGRETNKFIRLDWSATEFDDEN